MYCAGVHFNVIISMHGQFLTFLEFNKFVETIIWISKFAAFQTVAMSSEIYQTV
jgi:hypothetical protein